MRSRTDAVSTCTSHRLACLPFSSFLFHLTSTSIFIFISIFISSFLHPPLAAGRHSFLDFGPFTHFKTHYTHALYLQPTRPRPPHSKPPSISTSQVLQCFNNQSLCLRSPCFGDSDSLSTIYLCTNSGHLPPCLTPITIWR